MSPTIVLDDGRPVLAVGSPGGATIITTVTQVLLGTLDRELPLVDAIAAPRLSSRNGASSQAEPAIFDGPDGAALMALGHTLTWTPEIGAATAIRLLPGRHVRGRGRDQPPRRRVGDGGQSRLSALVRLSAPGSADRVDRVDGGLDVPHRDCRVLGSGLVDDVVPEPGGMHLRMGGDHDPVGLEFPDRRIQRGQRAVIAEAPSACRPSARRICRVASRRSWAALVVSSQTHTAPVCSA